ncbi:hypothetical protein PG989_014660 [Apiospora arundinis]
MVRHPSGHEIRATLGGILQVDDKNGNCELIFIRLLLGPGNGFVDARIINVGGGQVISDGDSGSWFIGWDTLEVYGHVVAADAFGCGHVIPIKDTMSDIQRKLNATSVSLPSTECSGNQARQETEACHSELIS